MADGESNLLKQRRVLSLRLYIPVTTKNNDDDNNNVLKAFTKN